MKKTTLTGGAVTFAALLAAGAATADISPQQAWDDLETYFESFGYSVSGAEAMSGDTLTVSNVVLSMALPEGGGNMDMSMPEISFTDRGDGSVSVNYPQNMPIKIAMAPEGEQIEVTLDYSHENLDMVISGDAENLQYSYSADSFGLRLANLTVEGETLGPNVARFDVTMSGVVGKSVSTGTTLRQIAQQMTADSVSYDAAFNDPDSDDNGLFSGSIEGIGFEGTLAMPVPMDANDMRAAMDAGFAVDGSFSSQSSKQEMAVTERSGTTTIQSSAGGGSFGVKMSADGIAYSVSSKMLELAMQGPEIPLPVNASADELSMNIALPLTPSETPQDVALGVTFAGVQISDLLWNIFDQGKILPRDPVTISVDMVGKATLMADLTNPEAINSVPAMPNALTLTNLLVEGVGARITGNGDVTFDPTDLESFDGVPAPEGTVNVQISGANGLIDKLIQMGLMSEEDAMGGRMMMSMFTVPGDGEDEMTSTIEITPEGHVLANGQRIK